MCGRFVCVAAWRLRPEPRLQGGSPNPRAAIAEYDSSHLSVPPFVLTTGKSVLISPDQLGIGFDIRATIKTATHVNYPAAKLLAIGIFLSPNIASADQLCGRQFDSFSQLYADVRSEADHGWRIVERATHVIMAGGQMIWAFARESQPAFPAVACLQVVQVEDSLEAIVQTRCEGAKDACDALVAKANTRDWSNLFGN